MSPEFGALSGLVLMFALGLRHGFDPDHIVCIDGFTWQSLEQRKVFAPWVGTLFAVGHGFMVTAIAIGVGVVSHTVRVSQELVETLTWVPTVLLFVVGILNLRQLLHTDQDYRPAGWRLRFVPKRLRRQSNPFAIVFVGMLFGAVFDTATQASMWAYVVTTEGGIVAALVAGLAFTLGMILTDTLDGRLLCRIVRRADGAKMGQRYRRALGWLIVGFSFGAGTYNIATALLPSIELNDATYSIVGFALLCIVVVIGIWPSHRKLWAAWSQ